MLEKDVKNPRRPRPHFTRDRNRSDVADSQEREKFQKEIVRESVEYLYGSKDIDYAKDEVLVLCQVRNGKPYVPSFVEHYLSHLGAKHIVFLDNGSTDGTIEALKNYRNVSVLRTELPYRTYNVAMKQYLIERFGKQRWTLLVDIDELFDYPFSDVVSLKALLRYLNEHSYTAVVAHMLDMFSEEPISQGKSLLEYEPLKEKYRFYDLSNIRRQNYHLADDTNNVVSNEDIEILRDGIRRTLFGNKALLIKHPLIFYDNNIKPMDLSDHWVSNARIADFTGVLFHYKFSDRLYEDVRLAVGEKNRSDDGTRRYSRFLEVLEKNPTLQIKQETSKELKGVDDLIGDRFVVVSQTFMGLVEEEVFRNSGESSLECLNNRIGEAKRLQKRLVEEGRQSPRQAKLRSETKFSRHPERLDAPETPELGRVQRFLLACNIEHLHGPKEVSYKKDELVVLCLLRNGKPYIKSFIEHYLSYLGAKHIVFLDNGSTDGTIEALKSYERVTVLRTTLPFKRYQLLMKRYLIERFGKNRWSLLVDIDELFDYPFSDVVSLKALLGYLNEHSYTAVVAHMLDMFSDSPLSQDALLPEYEPLKEKYRFYDLSNMRARNYYAHRGVSGTDNLVGNEEIQSLWDGVQAEIFGYEYPTPLTKHPLILYDGGLKPMDRTVHAVSNACLADITGVLFHYKFIDHLYEQTRRAVREENYMRDSYKQKEYLKVLERSPNLQIKRDTSRELANVNQLVEESFLTISGEYAERADVEDRKSIAHGSGREPRRLTEVFYKARDEAQSQKIQQLEHQVEKLRSRLEEERRRARTLEEKNVGLESRLRGIESSRGWRLLDGFNRLRIKMMRKK